MNGTSVEYELRDEEEYPMSHIDETEGYRGSEQQCQILLEIAKARTLAIFV